MNKTGYAIDHCEISVQASNKLSSEDFKEAVMDRADTLTRAAQTGEKTEPHKLPAVELVAQAVAHHVIEQGAARVASDMECDLDELKDLAASQHISFC